MDKVEEEEIQDITEILENGTEEERFKWALQNTIATCDAFNIYPHCLSLGLMEFFEFAQSKDEHHKENKTQH